VSKVEIDALLNRVKELGLGSLGRPKRFSNPSNNNNRPRQHGAAKKDTGNAKQYTSPQKKSIPQHKPKKLQTNLDGFDEMSSSFNALQNSTSKPTQQKLKIRAKDRRTVNRNASGSTQTSQSQKPRQGKGRPSSRRSNKEGEQFIQLTNPNLELLATHREYVPTPPTLSTLLETSPFTAQTSTSRILKAYNQLKADSDSDVSGILTGKASVAPLDVVNKMKTSQLKANADVVVNSLNKNGSLTYETKMKLLGPLTGTAPVKQLTA
jgi:hypothetical protein